MCEVFSSLDFRDIIIKRKRREQLDTRILKFRDLLIDRFAIAGSLDDIYSRIRSLLELCDHVVLGDPFFRDKNSLKQLKHLRANVLTSL
jgi:5,10-methylenetetrahydromethanopterin reductase